jgi:hypothetical protein
MAAHMLKTTFKNLIGGYSTLLADVVRSGVLTYPSVYSDNADVHCPRTQANIVYDHIVRSAVAKLPSSDFHMVRAKQRILFNFRDCCLIQFKKLRRNLKFSNFQTRQAELFERLGEIEGLPGLSVTIPLVTVGYVPKPFLAGIEGIFATFTQNHKPIWVDRLDDIEEPQNTIISILPNDPTPKPKKTRIRRTSTGDSATTFNKRQS